jgi:hypothetical protein
LQQVIAAAHAWVPQKTALEIRNQIALGNSKQFTSIVDGSRAKPIAEAKVKTQTFFVTTILAKQLERAKPVLVAAIRRATTEHSGLLAGGWSWFLQSGGKSGPVSRLGETLPGDLTLRAGDALILAPSARYAWFANYHAARRETFVPAEVRRARAGKGNRRKPPRGFGFMAYAARQLRAPLKNIGVSVWPVNSTTLAPSGTVSRFGVPILVFVVTSRLRTLN